VSSAAERGVSGAVTMGIVSLLVAAGSVYGALVFEIEDAQALVLVTFVPAAALGVIAALLDFAAAMKSGETSRRLLELGMVAFGLSLGWLTFCGVFAAGADLLGGGVDGTGAD